MPKNFEIMVLLSPLLRYGIPVYFYDTMFLLAPHSPLTVVKERRNFNVSLTS